MQYDENTQFSQSYKEAVISILTLSLRWVGVKTVKWVFSVLCDIVQYRKVLPVDAQPGNDLRLVLIFIATDNHQAIVCSGGVGRLGGEGRSVEV